MIQRRRYYEKLIILAACLCAAQPSRAQDEAPKPKAATKPILTTTIVYLGKKYEEPRPLSLLDPILKDEGIAGARLGREHDEETGRLIGQAYVLDEEVAEEKDDVTARARQALASGRKLIVADLESDDLLKVADLPEAADALIFDARTSDDGLRMKQCRRNVFHILPTWTMRADALGQYLLWKRWTRWFLMKGAAPEDEAYAEAFRRAAKRFGSTIVEERTYRFEAGSRRSETGHQQVQTQMPLATQGAPEHDVLVVADTREAFGDYLAYRTSAPRPVVGSQGLVAVAWHRSYEQYGGMAFQNRFAKETDRWPTERDYGAWLATRIIGEAVTRKGVNDVGSLRAYIESPGFKIAGFKGVALSFRDWDHQLRQPVLLSGARALVSVSPQEGFLHPDNETDSLGYDKPETTCRF